jgi:hypothetical protein
MGGEIATALEQHAMERLRCLEPQGGRAGGLPSLALLDIMSTLVEAAEGFQGAAHSRAAGRCCREAQLLSVLLRQPQQAAMLLSGDTEQAQRAANAMERYEDSHTILTAKGNTAGASGQCRENVDGCN